MIKADIKDNIELLAPAATQDREKTLAAITDKAKQVGWKLRKSYRVGRCGRVENLGYGANGK